MLKAVTRFDEAHNVALTSVGQYREGLEQWLDKCEEYAKVNKQIKQSRAALAMSNLLQCMYKKSGPDIKSIEVSRALSKAQSKCGELMNTRLCAAASELVR